jgi:hypothetical protein
LNSKTLVRETITIAEKKSFVEQNRGLIDEIKRH